MPKPNIQIDDLVREMTDEEYSDFQIHEKEALDFKVELEARQQIRQSTLAKLADLGLTQDEINAL
jgi:hypothetical protein